MLYICAKFHEIVLNGINVRVDTISFGKITKGNNSAKTEGGATVVNLCMSSVIFLPSFVKLSRTVSKL